MKKLNLSFLLAAISLIPTPGFGAIRIIVNAKNPTKETTRKFLADAFMKKITFWDEGGVIAPVDLQPESPIRKEFSEQVIKRPATAIRSYWQQMIFSGQSIPPVEFDTEEQVIQYIGVHPNSIGYVSDTANLNSKVKVVNWK
jgi:ABC-type phosphate transport system substrate-binding protein